MFPLFAVPQSSRSTRVTQVNFHPKSNGLAIAIHMHAVACFLRDEPRRLYRSDLDFESANSNLRSSQDVTCGALFILKAMELDYSRAQLVEPALSKLFILQSLSNFGE